MFLPPTDTNTTKGTNIMKVEAFFIQNADKTQADEVTEGEYVDLLIAYVTANEEVDQEFINPPHSKNETWLYLTDYKGLNYL